MIDPDAMAAAVRVLCMPPQWVPAGPDVAAVESACHALGWPWERGRGAALFLLRTQWGAMR